MHRRFHDQYLDKGLRGWIVKTAKKHYWRVAAYQDLDDLIQEGFLAYAICRSRYRDRVKNKRHFMALVQVVFINRITDMANERTGEATRVLSDGKRTYQIEVGTTLSASQIAADGKELVALEYLAGGFQGDAELQAALATAPAEVRRFLELFDSPEGLAELDKPLRRRADHTRETFNERISLLLGMPVEDIEATLRNILGLRAA